MCNLKQCFGMLWRRSLPAHLHSPSRPARSSTRHIQRCGLLPLAALGHLDQCRKVTLAIMVKTQVEHHSCECTHCECTHVMTCMAECILSEASALRNILLGQGSLRWDGRSALGGSQLKHCVWHHHPQYASQTVKGMAHPRTTTNRGMAEN